MKNDYPCVKKETSVMDADNLGSHASYSPILYRYSLPVWTIRARTYKTVFARDVYKFAYI